MSKKRKLYCTQKRESIGKTNFNVYREKIPNILDNFSNNLVLIISGIITIQPTTVSPDKLQDINEKQTILLNTTNMGFALHAIFHVLNINSIRQNNILLFTPIAPTCTFTRSLTST